MPENEGYAPPSVNLAAYRTPKVEKAARDFLAGMTDSQKSRLVQTAPAARGRIAMRQEINVQRDLWSTEPLKGVPIDEIGETLFNAYKEIGSDPVLANQIATSGYAMVTSPEILLGLAGEIDSGTVGVSVMSQFLDPAVQTLGPNVEEDLLADGGLTAQWLQDTRNHFQSEEREQIMMLLGGVHAYQREQIVALANQWLERQPMESRADRDKFLNFLYDKARAAKQEWAAENNGGFMSKTGWFGQLGSLVDAPRQFLTDQIIKPIYLSVITNDEEYMWRKPMSIGQNIALSSGYGPGDEGFDNRSGMIDGFNQLFGDPVSYLFGLGIAVKGGRFAMEGSEVLIKAIPEGAGFFRRLPVAARAALPVVGRKYTALPAGSRQPSARFFSALHFTKRADELMETRSGQRMVENLVDVMKRGGGHTELAARAPAFAESISAELAHLLGSRDTYEVLANAGIDHKGWVKDVLIGGMLGHIKPGQGAVYRRVTEAQQQAKAAWDGAIVNAVQSGQVGARHVDVLDPVLWFGHEFGGAYKVQVGADAATMVNDWDVAGRASAAGALATKAGEWDDTAQGAVMFLASDAKVINLGDDAVLNDLYNWARTRRNYNHPNSAARKIVQIVADARAMGVETIALALRSEMDRSPALTSAIIRYAERNLADAIGAGGAMIVTNRGARRAVLGVDDPALPGAQNALRGLKSQRRHTQQAYDMFMSQKPFTYHVLDLPHQLGTLSAGRYRKAWSGYGVGRNALKNTAEFRNANFGRKLFRPFRRWFQQAFTNMVVPAHNATELDWSKNTNEALSALASIMTRMGADRATVTRVTDAILSVSIDTPHLRMKIAKDALIEQAAAVGNPVLAAKLIDFWQNTGSMDFGTQGARKLGEYFDGTELGGLSKPLPDGRSWVALLPEHTTVKMPLPDARILYQPTRRAAVARGAQRIGAGRWVRGFGQTGRDREKLATAYQGVVSRRTGLKLTKEEAWVAAYSQVMDDTAVGGLNGLGIWSRIFNQIHGGIWKPIFSVFALAQLVLQPIAWAGRVVFLEESWRAAMMGLPSMSGSPLRYLGELWVQNNIFAVGRYQDNMRPRVAQWVGDVFNTAQNPAEALTKIGDMTPEFIKTLKDPHLMTMGQVQRRWASWLERTVIDNGIISTPLRESLGMQARIQQHRFIKGKKVMDDMGLPLEFRFGNGPEDFSSASELFRHHMANEYTLRRGYNYDNISSDGLINANRQTRADFGQGYFRMIHQMVESPISNNYGLRRAVYRAHGLEPPIFLTGEYLAKDREWLAIRENFIHWVKDQKQNHRRFQNVDIRHEASLAQLYLDEIVDYRVDTLLSGLVNPLLGPEQMGIVADTLRRTRRLNVDVDGTVHNLRFGQQANDASNDFVAYMNASINRYGSEYRLPGVVQTQRTLGTGFGHNNGRTTLKDLGNVFRRTLHTFAGKPLHTFGVRPSMYLNRRPAFISLYRRHYDMYLRLGWSKADAYEAARLKAIDQTNYVFYNTDRVSPFVAMMNRDLVPYFSAWWEVLQTWGYKIPMYHSGFMGYPAMVRKVDRTLDAMREMGLLETDPDTGQMTLNIDQNFADGIGGLPERLMWNTQHLLMKPMHAITHLLGLKGNDPALAGRTNFQFRIGNPLNPLSQGIGNVNQGWQIGSGPVLGTLLSQAILPRMREALDFKKIETEGETTFGDLAEEWEVLPGEIYHNNKKVLEQIFGATELEAWQRRDLDPFLMVIPAGTKLKIPGSDFWSSMVEEIFLPYGEQEFNWLSWVPNGPRTMLASWSGLNDGVTYNKGTGDDEDYEVVEGMLELGGYPIQTQRMFSSELYLAMAYLQKEEPYLENIMELLARGDKILEDIPAEAIETMQDGRVVLGPLAEPGVQREWEDIMGQVEAIETELISRAHGIARSSMMIRGLLGVVSPSTPRMVSDEQRAMEQYYWARELTQANLEGRDTKEIMLPERLPDSIFEGMEDFENLMSAWLGREQTGSFARGWLQENAPDMWPLSFGRTFWTPGGEPPEDQVFDDWLAGLESGLYEYKDPSLFLIQQARADISAEYEREIVRLAGNSGGGQALWATENWYVFNKEMTADRNAQFAMVDWWDSEFNGGGYAEWSERFEDDPAVLLNRIRALEDSLADTIDMLSLPLAQVLNIPPEEFDDHVNALKGWSRQFKDAINFWRESMPEQYWSDRSETLARFFDHTGQYYDMLGVEYDKLDDAVTVAEQNAVWAAIQQIEDTVGTQPIIIGGREFPPPLQFRWNGWSPEQQQQALDQWLVQPVEWSNRFEAQKLVEHYPQVEQYIPTRDEDWELYTQYNNARAAIREKGSLDPTTGVAIWTDYQRNKALTALDEKMEDILISTNRTSELWWRVATPAEKLNIAGVLPLPLQQFMPQANLTMEYLRSLDKSSATTEGERVWRLFLTEILRAGEMNPAILEELRKIGGLLFEDRELLSLVPRLFGGSTGEYVGL